MTMTHGALFDLDGVLIDSESQYSQFWSSMDRLYPTGVNDFAMVIKGSTLPKILNTYFPDATMQADIRQQLSEFENNMHLPMYGGVPELLRSLRQAGWKLAVVTSSNPAKMAVVRLHNPGFDSIFDTIITDADVTRSKPDPQGYMIAAERLGCRPDQCVVFEDSINGLKAGRRSGARVVGVATTNPRQTIAPLADMVIDLTAQATIDSLTALFCIGK